MPHIEQIPLELALQMRHKAMYPDKNPEAVRLAADEDGIHFGLFDNNQLISVVSWFRHNETEAQFRKLATLKEYRNSGYGTALLNYIVDFSRGDGIHRLWCNARENALNFYKKLGFTETQNRFKKDDMQYIIIQLELY